MVPFLDTKNATKAGLAQVIEEHVSTSFVPSYNIVNSVLLIFKLHSLEAFALIEQSCDQTSFGVTSTTGAVKFYHKYCD